MKDNAAKHFPVSVKGVCVQAGRVLLLHNERNEWELPGGKLELGEEPAACVAREISEESGWQVRVGDILDSWQYHIRDGVDVLIVTYGCYVDTKTEPVVSHEHKEAGLFTLDEVAQLRMPQGYKNSIGNWFSRLESATSPVLRLRSMDAQLARHAICVESNGSKRQALDDESMPEVGTPVAALFWASREAQAVIATGDLAAIVKHYRRLTGTSQRRLAAGLGFDHTYISAIENGRRTISQVPELRRIAAHIGIPAYVLGVSDPDNNDFTTLIAFAESAVRLAVLARNTGNPTHAINELWPLVQRLEERVLSYGGELATLTVLAKARMHLGICLGDVLPERQLNVSAQWTRRALSLAAHTNEPELHTTAMRAHGNELRKAGATIKAVEQLQHAAARGSQPATFIALARAAAESGNELLFAETLTELQNTMETTAHTPLFNELVCWEVETRGLLRTHQINRLTTLVDKAPTLANAAPQWKIIAAITTADALHALGSSDTADILATAITDAQQHRLPHQLQRAARTAARHHPHITDHATAAIDALTARAEHRFQGVGCSQVPPSNAN